MNYWPRWPNKPSPKHCSRNREADTPHSAIDARGSARKKLQAALDQMAHVKAPKFNKFESDGHPAY